MPSHRNNIRILLGALLIAATTIATAAPQIPPTLYADLHWRLIGPFRGGQATAVAGIADQPDTFFAGTAGGGIWKTTNAGRSWTVLTDTLPVAAIGALAIAGSDANVIYAGTGAVDAGDDIAAGNGVYRSNDGGNSWQHIGLDATRNIAAIHVDPRDANIVTVAALGHVAAPNPERGLYRSIDGGANWQHVLTIDDDTGAVDLAADPANPDVLYAASWQLRRWPWTGDFTPLAGAGGALYKSVDGGATWTRLDGEGWPQHPLGRIGLAVAHTDAGTRIYAGIDADSDGGFWRSDDGGDHWQRVNDGAGLSGDKPSRRLVVAPDHPDTVYVIGSSIRRSTDAGVTWTTVHSAAGRDDYHALWINPLHTERWIAAGDGGAIVSIDGGRTWSSGDNQPTAGFHRLAADERFPYRIYSGGIVIASRSDDGALGVRDWQPVGNDERSVTIPDPVDLNIVYSGAPGGRISRRDARTGQAADISPWSLSNDGKLPVTIKNRNARIVPLAISPAGAHAFYFGAQRLFRSNDRGTTWQIVSPDLTGKIAGAKNCDGEITLANASACGHGTISTIVPSPVNESEIWIGTDNGLIELTRDGGAHWIDVTPKSLPAWARVSTLDLSAPDPGTAYAAVDNRRQDDFQPHAFRTRDGGKSWQDIGSGLPADHVVSVVRADPLRRGLLYAGTDAGIHVSFDDGAHWQPLQQNLPSVWVRDLLVHGDDLIVATQGRALWVMDNITPLRQLAPGLAARPMFLFTPVVATRIHDISHRDSSSPEEPLGENPPAGAVIDYWIAARKTERVTIEILDSERKPVRRFSSDDAPDAIEAGRSVTAGSLNLQAPPATTSGMHRFVWDLRYSRPKTIRRVADDGTYTPAPPPGPYAPPGRYEIVLRAAGREARALLIVKPDPRVSMSTADYGAAFDFSQAVGAALAKAWQGEAEVQAARRQVETLIPGLPDDPSAQALRDAMKALDERLQGGKDDTAADAAPDFSAISDTLVTLANAADAADTVPTVAQQQLLAACSDRLKQTSARWQTLRDNDLARLNDQLREAGLAQVTIPPVDKLTLDSGRDRKQVW
jgi:photosystem II stability/assembly factor-like uncharacterized protein